MKELLVEECFAVDVALVTLDPDDRYTNYPVIVILSLDGRELKNYIRAGTGEYCLFKIWGLGEPADEPGGSDHRRTGWWSDAA